MKRIYKTLFVAVAAGLFSFAAGCGGDKPDAGSAEKVPLNVPVHPFALQGIDGLPVSLESELEKKAVLLVFWTTWCPSCVAEIPHLNRMAVEHQDTLSILGVNIQEDRDLVASFVARRIGYKALLDSDGKVARLYGVTAVPTLQLIGRDGKVYYRGHSSSGAEKMLEQALGAAFEPAAED